MAINYAAKYSSEVDERFRVSGLTEPAVNRAYDWAGVDTVHVYSVSAAAMRDYTVSGTARYGTPAELDGSARALTLTRDRAFTFTIDRRGLESAMMTLEAGAALARQIDEAVIPEIDVYRIAKLCEEAGLGKTETVSAGNAYDSFLDAATALTDAKAPLTGRVALITPRFYKAVKLDGAFMRSCDLAQEMLKNGQVGQIDGVPLILAPQSYFPADVSFVLTHPSALVAPVKLCDYKIHDNPPGINGWLVEGRVVYDAFALDNKKDAIYVHYTA